SRRDAIRQIYARLGGELGEAVPAAVLDLLGSEPVPEIDAEERLARREELLMLREELLTLREELARLEEAHRPIAREHEALCRENPTLRRAMEYFQHQHAL